MNVIILIYRYLQPYPMLSLLSILVAAAKGKKSHALETIEVDPFSIKKWITPKEEPDISNSWPGQVKGGDWHLRAKELQSCGAGCDIDYLKQKAIYERYDEGKPWRETQLFMRCYEKRLSLGPVRNNRTVSELVSYYESTYDAIYQDISMNGIRTPTLRDPNPTFIYVHVGPEGEVIASDNGNHRIAMAKQLGLRSISVKVLRMHIGAVNSRSVV